MYIFVKEINVVYSDFLFFGWNGEWKSRFILSGLFFNCKVVIIFCGVYFKSVGSKEFYDEVI